MKREYTFTYKDISDRKKKNLAILDCIRKKQTISRTDISKETGINIVSISNYVMNHIKNKLVLECGLDISTGGRRPELVKLNLEEAYVIGIDIGPDNITAIISDLSLMKKAQKTIPRPKGDMDDVITGTVSVIEELVKESGVPSNTIKVIGIGASGIVDIYSGTIHDTDYNRGRTTTSLFNMARLIEEKFNITTLIGNDATCAAFGEMSLNPRSDIRDMLYLYADLGCGIIINGDIYCGASGCAGEIQLLFTNIKGDQRANLQELAAYGARGIDFAIVNNAKKFIEKGKKTEILNLAGNNKEQITKEIIFNAAHKGDDLAKELLMDAAHWLGIKVAYLINIFNPQFVIIGGGMAKAGNVFMDPLATYTKMYAYEEAFDAVKILPSFLEEDAVSVGAAALSIRELFLNA